MVPQASFGPATIFWPWRPAEGNEPWHATQMHVSTTGAKNRSARDENRFVGFARDDDMLVGNDENMYGPTVAPRSDSPKGSLAKTKQECSDTCPKVHLSF